MNDIQLFLLGGHMGYLPYKTLITLISLLTSYLAILITKSSCPEWLLVIDNNLKWGAIQLVILLINALLVMYVVTLQDIAYENKPLVHISVILAHLGFVQSIAISSEQQGMFAVAVLIVIGIMSLWFRKYPKDWDEATIVKGIYKCIGCGLAAGVISAVSALLIHVVIREFPDYLFAIKNIDNSKWVFIPAVIVPLANLQFICFAGPRLLSRRAKLLSIDGALTIVVLGVLNFWAGCHLIGFNEFKIQNPDNIDFLFIGGRYAMVFMTLFYLAWLIIIKFGGKRVVSSFVIFSFAGLLVSVGVYECNLEFNTYMETIGKQVEKIPLVPLIVGYTLSGGVAGIIGTIILKKYFVVDFPDSR